MWKCGTGGWRDSRDDKVEDTILLSKSSQIAAYSQGLINPPDDSGLHG